MANTTVGNCYPLFEDDTLCDIILGIRTVLAVFSMICCLFIAFLIILFKKYKFLSQRLILYLAVSAFFQSILYATTNFHISGRASHDIDTGFCILQGYWTLFFDWLAFIWVLCICFNVFWTAIFLKKTDSFEKWYLIIDITLPIVICCFPFIGDSYGPAGLWCWIGSRRDGQVYITGVVLQFVLFYGPLWVLSITMLCMLTVVLVTLHYRKKRGGADSNLDIQQDLWKEEIRPIFFFPIVYIAILVFPSINRIRIAAGYTDVSTAANFFFWFMHSITLTFHGSVYALLFACDRQTMSRIRWVHIKAAATRWYIKPAKEYKVSENKLRETFYGRKKQTIAN